MPRGHKCELTDDDFIAAARAIDEAGESVSLTSLRMHLGIGLATVSSRIKRLRERPEWKPEWVTPGNFRPRGGPYRSMRKK